MSRKLKRGFFVLEGLNAVATTGYFYYLFFYLSERFGFGNRENLAVTALNGFVYMFAAIHGGRFAQKHGYFSSLQLGFGIMIVALITGGALDFLSLNYKWQLGAMILWTIGMCYTWPALEGAVSEKETPASLGRVIGVYNMVWASGGALAYFFGGALIEKGGLRTLFAVPVILHAIQWGILARMEGWPEERVEKSGRVEGPLEFNPRPIARAKMFQRMAWVANPFAYIAINTVIPLIPFIAAKLELSPMFAGFFCSIWFFARVATFLFLWLWPGWHYRTGWFFSAFALLLVSFAVILLVPRLAVIVLAEIFFGMGLGLIYYSSLFYSMDVGENKGEHGGIHEAAIGVGICVGPGVGAASLYFWKSPASGTVAVAILLFAGFLCLLLLRFRPRA